MSAITNRLPAVTVEYTWGNQGKRIEKRFEDANEAKTFYAKKEKDGKSPKLVGPDESKPPVTTVETPVVDKAGPTKAEGTPKTRGVQYKATRPYYAGVVVKRHGVAAGVTDAMVAELDELYGKPNPRESQFCLKNAWHAVRGFVK